MGNLQRVRVIEEEPRKGKRARGANKRREPKGLRTWAPAIRSRGAKKNTKTGRTFARSALGQQKDAAVLLKKLQPAWTLTPELTARMVKYFKEGLPIQTVCDLTCCAYSTFKEWHRKALQWRDGGGKDETLTMYGQWAIAIRQARAHFLRVLARRAKKRNNSYWVQNVTLLERRDRRHYSGKEPEGGTAEQHNPSEMFR